MPVGDGEAGGTTGEFGWILDADEVRRRACGLEFLSLFHGALGRSGGLYHVVVSFGAKVVAFHLEIDLRRRWHSHALQDVLGRKVVRGWRSGALAGRV